MIRLLKIIKDSSVRPCDQNHGAKQWQNHHWLLSLWSITVIKTYQVIESTFHFAKKAVWSNSASDSSWCTGACWPWIHTIDTSSASARQGWSVANYVDRLWAALNTEPRRNDVQWIVVWYWSAPASAWFWQGSATLNNHEQPVNTCKHMYTL